MNIDGIGKVELPFGKVSFCCLEAFEEWYVFFAEIGEGEGSFAGVKR